MNLTENAAQMLAALHKIKRLVTELMNGSDESSRAELIAEIANTALQSISLAEGENT